MIFFILSGFWITRSFYTSKSILEFYKKRVKKIFPAYLTVVFAAAILLVFMSTLTVGEYFTNNEFWKYLGANISTLNFLHPSLPGVFNGEPVNGSLWTIKVELGFYIILPLITFLCIGKKNSGIGKNRCLVVLVVIYILSALYVILMPYFVKQYHLPSSIVNQLPAFMSYFTVGMVFFYFFEKLIPLLNYLVAPAVILLILCLILKNILLTALLEPIVLIIVVMWLALKAKLFFCFSKVYDFSYWLYLVHYPIIMVVKYLCLQQV